MVIAITGRCKHGSRTFVLSNLYHQIKILRCIELENGIWESLINSWARIRQGYHLFVKVIEILLLMNGSNHSWTINIKAYRRKGFSDYRTITRYYQLVSQSQSELLVKILFLIRTVIRMKKRSIYKSTIISQTLLPEVGEICDRVSVFPDLGGSKCKRFCPQMSPVVQSEELIINIFTVSGYIPFKNFLSKICMLNYSDAPPGHLSSIEAEHFFA